MAVEVQASIRFTCDLCGRSQVTSPAPVDPLICRAAAQVQVAANLDAERRISVKWELCDRCYSALVRAFTSLQGRLGASE